MNSELSKRAKAKIRASWLSEEVSVAPSPSVSSTKIGWGPVRSMAKMMPLVQELTADDVSKARVRRSRFSRKLFPVRYNPATATLATGSSPKVSRRAMASGETE